MKILWGLPGSQSGWMAAAKSLGHTLLIHDPRRPYDGFFRKPDVAVLTCQQLSAPVQECVEKWEGKLTVLSESAIHPQHLRDRIDLILISPTSENWTQKKAIVYRPALDAPRNMPPGTFQKHLECDVCFVGDYHEGLFVALKDVCQSGLNVKIFGRGHPFHQCLGTLSHDELANAYASAKVSLDLELSPEKGLAVYAAGGALVTSRRYLGTGIDCLTYAPTTPHENDLANTIRSLIELNFDFSSCRDEVLSQHTYSHRLEEILNA